MAGVRFIVPFTVTTSTSTITVAQIVAATNQRVRIERIVITGKGVLNTDAPCTFEMLPQTSAGTSSAETPVKQNASDAETIQTTARTGFSSTEPTDAGGSIVKQKWAIHPQGGKDIVFPPGRDMYVKGGERMGLRINTPAQASTYVGHIECEE